MSQPDQRFLNSSPPRIHRQATFIQKPNLTAMKATGDENARCRRMGIFFEILN